MLAVDLPDASTPTPEPTIADLMREVLAIRDRLAGLEQRVWSVSARWSGSTAASPHSPPGSTTLRSDRSAPDRRRA
jgi:hypothetical protein